MNRTSREVMRAGHPHRRGELRPRVAMAPSHVGPSPQAWGTLPAQHGFRFQHRAIPTGVGNSSWEESCSTRRAGHPHRRGELTCGTQWNRAPRGPSPQAWGTPAARAARPRCDRAIPTGVGNSGRARAQTGPLTGHPHRRGELRAALFSQRLMPGPSPQAWGTRGLGEGLDEGARAIPTGVGNSNQRD